MYLGAAFISVAILAGTVLAADAGISATPATVRNGIYEAALKSSHQYANPVADVDLAVEFTSPSGKTACAWAFWDGGNVWGVRFSPDEVGKWSWETKCSDSKNAALHGRRGSFMCERYTGRNPLLIRGPLKLSDNRRYFIHSDGTPFFWLADTAWNGVLKSKPGHWDKYLVTRRSQGFTAVQFVASQWRAYDSELAYTGKRDVRINPDFFKRLDPKIKAINNHGMVAAPVMMWAVGGSDPGHELSEQDAIRLGRYMVARWGAYNVFWILAGDGVYLGDRAERWQRIGRAVFGESPNRPATMHPTGTQWVAREFANEAWYSMIGYQSAHRTRRVPWLVQGPPATDWKKTPTLPIVNLEPNYEGILDYDTGRPFDALDVRTALYRSLLVSPTAGVTYGNHGIWWWGDKPEIPMDHPKCGVAQPWDQELKSESAQSIRHLARLFASIQWWTLAPDLSIVAGQPDDPMRFMPASRNDDGSLALVYLPQEGEIELDTAKLKPNSRVRWFSPSTGRYSSAGTVAGNTLKLQPPGGGDWLLVIALNPP